MYGNVYVDLLWLIMLAKYLIKERNMTRSKQILAFYKKKDDDGKLELVMSVYLDDSFMEGRPYTIEKIK